MRRTTSLAAAFLLGVAVLTAGVAAPAAAGSSGAGKGDKRACKHEKKIQVPGAERQRVACLSDLTTAGLMAASRSGTTYTVEAQWAGLHAPGTTNPTGVPGVQVDGFFPDSSTTNATHGRNHDSQFVIRLPENWNGGLVVTGAPGVRGQYSNDFLISDWVLSKGYAFASTDKGNTGLGFHTDGTQPGDAVVEWHQRVTQLTRAAKVVVQQRYGGNKLRRTIMTGISNGGYLTRYQIENHADLYDGAVDWEGTLFRADGPNLLTYLPPVLRGFQQYESSDPATREAGRQAILAAGMPVGSEFQWPTYNQVYWGLTQDIYAKELDPTYTGTPAAYDYASRPEAVRQAVRRVENTGRIGKPMITVQGALDTLLPPKTNSDAYRTLVEQQGRAALHRYWVVEGGTHVDGFQPLFGAQMRPTLPCYRDAFLALEGWIGQGVAPRPDVLVVPRRSGDELNRC